MLQQARALLILLTLSLGAPALAQEAELGSQDRDAIRQVIESQLAAFQRDDAAGAFAFASPRRCSAIRPPS